MLFERMMRAARLDSSLYEEVEADRSLTGQAATVVAIVAVCQGLGIAIAAGNTRGTGAAATALVGALIAAFVVWVLWSYTTYWVGTILLKGTATPGQMLRTLGFALTPGVLGIFGFIPLLGDLLRGVAVVLILIAGIVAVRQALDFGTGKAVLTVMVGWLALTAITIAAGITTASPAV